MHHRPFITFFCLLPQLGVAAPLEYPKLEWRRGGEGVPRGGTQLYARVLLHRRQALDRPDERIILSNCVDSNGVKSSKMAYYNGEAGPAPESVAIVDNPGGGTQIWEETTTTAKFGDDVSFSARISGVVGEGEFAGTGKNNFVDFACWKRFKRNLFNWDDDTCTGIYECTHEPRPVSSLNSFLFCAWKLTRSSETNSHSRQAPTRGYHLYFRDHLVFACEHALASVYDSYDHGRAIGEHHRYHYHFC